MGVVNDQGWFEFDGLVEPMTWGRSTYVIVRLDPALAEAAADAGTRRVEGTIDDQDVNVGVNRADMIPDAFMYAGRPLLRRLGARAGDVVHCRLRPADPDHVPVPEDVEAALVGAGRLDAFELRPAPQRRRLLQPVEEARTSATRERRIVALVRSLTPP